MKRALAASFVVTVAAMPAAACKKTSDGENEGPDTARVYRDYSGIGCRYSVPEHCPKNATCNPPPPREVDCPPDLRDAGDPPAVTRRPAGKQDWLRMPSTIWLNEPECTVNPETFCAPAGKPIACTTAPAGQKVACTRMAGDGGVKDPQVRADDRFKLVSFIWRDGTGSCHKIPELECVANKKCDLPEGEIVPCP
jgi:hypothetical protein